ncbi:MAG: TIGR02391 family protein [Oligoflexales bacterium]
MKPRNKIPNFSQAHIVAISKILGDTEKGLKGYEIGQTLQSCGIPDCSPLLTKWKRIHDAFCSVQNSEQIGNRVVLFINRSMDPALFVRNPDIFRWRQEELKKALSLSGLSINDSGRVTFTKAAETLDDAIAAANRMKSELERRKAHPHVFQFCNAEILTENYFHSVVEAMKSITSRIRSLANTDGDGVDLLDSAFGFKFPQLPRVAINSLDTPTRQGEQRGFLNLLKGLYGVIRNPLSHEAKIEWDMDEQDALDILTTISFVHRKLDASIPISRKEDI